MQITYDGILNCIKSNKYIINSEPNILQRKSSKKVINKEKRDEQSLKLDKGNEELSKFSKLIIVLYNICFKNDIKNIKYRIIGNIMPIAKFFKITRDTLLFCSNCYKILNKTSANLIVSDELKKKNDIDDLNFTIKLQRKQIDTLNHFLEKKNNQITFLSKHYNAQINAIKKYFSFDGDPNTLITGEIDLNKDNYMKHIKNKMKKQEEEFEENKKKLEELEQELLRHKNITNIKINDETMVNYYLSVKGNNLIKNYENKLINSLSKEIMELNGTIKKKEKIIEGLKKDLNKKNNILCNLHKITSNKKNVKENEKIKDKNELNDIIFNLNEEIRKMKINEENNIKALDNKYNSILNEKKEVIYLIQQRLNGIEDIYKSEIETLNKELVMLYEIILGLINGYQGLFTENNLGEIKLNLRKKDEFDNTIADIDKDVNCLNFVSLYKELKNQNKTKQTIIDTLTKENINNIQRIINNNGISDKDIIKKDKIIISAKDMAIKELNNKLLSMSHYLKDQVKQNNQNNIIINSQKMTIERMQKSSLIYQNLLKNKIKDNLLSSNKHNSPTFIKRRFIKKNILKDLNLTNNSNNIKQLNSDQRIINDLTLIKKPSDSSLSNRTKKLNIVNKSKDRKVSFFIKNNQRPFSSDNSKNNN